jgi:hypothetical protein
MSEESAKFDAIVRKVFSVSHDEIVKREKEWKRKRQRAKIKRGRPPQQAAKKVKK